MIGDTIVAPAMPLAGSTRLALRVSGPGAFDAVGCVSADGFVRRPGCGVCRVTVRSIELPALWFAWLGPRSYTGEDVAELQFAGSPMIARALIDAIASHEGVRPAHPGEFTARAYLNGRLTGEDADRIAQLIAARNTDDLELARSGGRVRSSLDQLADRLADLLALVEAGIDFAEEDGVVAIEPDALRAQLGEIDRSLDALAGSASRATRDGLPRVVLTGRPNAGKSTLFNALLGYPRAIISDEAGTTRDAIEQQTDIGGRSVVLTDIAGLDEAIAARSTLDALGQSRAAAAIADADVVVHCDPAAADPPGPMPTGAPLIRVRTKADRPRPAGGAGPQAIDVCALDSTGLRALREAIAAALDADQGVEATDSADAELRRSIGLTRARLTEASEHAAARAGDEVIAASLRSALDALGGATRPRSPDEVLGRIYARFCLGK